MWSTPTNLEGVNFGSIARRSGSTATSALAGLGGISRDALAVARAPFAGDENHEVGVVDDACPNQKHT